MNQIKNQYIYARAHNFDILKNLKLKTKGNNIFLFKHQHANINNMEYTLNLCNNKTISMEDIDTDKLDKFTFSIHCKNITIGLIRSLNLDPQFLVFNSR